MAGTGNYLFAGTSSGIFRSADNAASWSGANAGIDSPFVSSLFVNGSDLFVGFNKGVLRSADNAATWTDVSEGLPAASIDCLAISGAYLVAGSTSGVWRRKLAEISSGIALPGTSARETGFGPHPDNQLRPGSGIDFTTARPGPADLGVYDTRGNRKGTLLHSHLATGAHNATLEGAGMATGAYTLVLHAGGTVRTRRFIFRK